MKTEITAETLLSEMRPKVEQILISMGRNGREGDQSQRAEQLIWEHETCRWPEMTEEARELHYAKILYLREFLAVYRTVSVLNKRRGIKTRME